MTISELIATLEELSEEYGDEVSVRVAIQRNWPLAERISDVSVQEYNDEYASPVLWIATDPVSFGHPYAPRGAWGGDYE